jgi:hypothetical protein
VNFVEITVKVTKKIQNKIVLIISDIRKKIRGGEKKVVKKFGGEEKSQYFCTRFRREAGP